MPEGLLMSVRTPPKPVASARGKVASLTRSREPDDPDLLDARRTLAAANLEDYVSRVVDAAPPLTPEQASQIAALLRPNGEPPGWESPTPASSLGVR